MIKLIFIFSILTFLGFSQNFIHSGYVYNANEVGVSGIPIKVYKRVTPNLQGFTQQTNYNGHSYYRSIVTDYWLNAKTACENMNGHLVTISNAAENNFVYSTWPSGWIGYYQDYSGAFYSEPNGGWRWTEKYVTTGQQVVYNTNSYTAGATFTDTKNSLNMTLYNSPVLTVGGGRYLTFNGTQYGITSDLSPIHSGSSPNKSTITSLSIWFFPTNNGVILTELGTTSITSSWFESVMEITGGNTLRCGFWNGSSISQISSPIVLNQWHMVTMTYDGTSLKGYLNGNLFGSTSFVRQAPYNNGYNAQTYALGYGTMTNMGSGLNGSFRLGSFEIFNTVLTSDEVNRNYMSTAWRFGVYPFSNWNGGEPNNAGTEDYIQFVGGGLWNDLPNAVSLNYVLEFDYIVTTTPWTLETVLTTNSLGQYSINLPTNPSIEWYIEVGGLIIPNPSVSDAQSIISTVFSNSINSKKYYLYDVNNDGKFTISDVYYTRGMISGRFTNWLNPTPNYRLFLQNDWNVIKNSSSNLKLSYPGTQTVTINNPVNGGSTNFYLLRTGFSN